MGGVFCAIEVVFIWYYAVGKIDFFLDILKGIRCESVSLFLFYVYCCGLEDSKYLLPVIITYFS